MTIEQRLLQLEASLQKACESAGRQRSEVTLVAVTKGVPLESIQEAHRLGVRNFGESRLQEALPNTEAIPEATWHFIGKLQSNKVLRAARVFSVVHSLESRNQLQELAKLDSILDALIEVNIADEQQKAGISADGLDEFIDNVLNCPQVRLRGLMTVGPTVQNAESMRPYFRKLRQLLEKVPGGTWLSMGMSSDFEVAIQEGSTHVRIGSALFRERA